MSVIFLDIDGVLNNIERCRWLNENFHAGSGFGSLLSLMAGDVTIETTGWDPNNVEALQRILETTNSDIVISSTWRFVPGMNVIQSCFDVFDISPNVIGYTPRVERIGSTRGDEINAWLNDHREVETCVILDDDSDFYDDQPLVQTSAFTGLTQQDAQRAIDILQV